MKHLIDTKIRLAECNRCKSYVFACMSSGLRTAVDPQPLDSRTLASALIGMQEVYVLRTQAGRPHKLDRLRLTHLDRVPLGELVVLKAHGCGCKAMDASVFEESAPEPPKARVQAPTGVLGPLEPRTGRVEPARSRPSDLRAVRCANCDKVIPAGDTNRMQIEWPVWQDEETSQKVGSRIKTMSIKGWGTKTWAVHSEGCP